MYPVSYMFGLASFTDGAWYEPTPNEKIQQIIACAQIKPGQKAVDLGSGDGRIVIALAQAGAKAVGIEKDRKLVDISRANIRKANLSRQATITHANFWTIGLQEFDIVVMYQFKTIMERLETKLQAELPKHALVISNYWQLPHWIPCKQSGEIYLYQKKAHNPSFPLL